MTFFFYLKEVSPLSSGDEELTDESALKAKRAALHGLILGNTFLHTKALTYEPIGMRQLQSLAADKGYDFHDNDIKDFCDFYCISYFEEDKKAVKGNMPGRIRKK